MPRQARIDAPGELHHVIICGFERKAIFKDEKVMSKFISRGCHDHDSKDIATELFD